MTKQKRMPVWKRFRQLFIRQSGLLEGTLTELGFNIALGTFLVIIIAIGLIVGPMVAEPTPHEIYQQAYKECVVDTALTDAQCEAIALEVVNE